ncbi:hypothetical protein MTR67_045512 [Solanum verrucosum]|uniref:Uncharacterized protein n=1 Tax=Solanum verrucosum TaxID=315347 RepID=A0AAF0ZTU3_SOLVR|nr:hypothetical protein MTR67_045512 [Solanum verrucosum]
MYVPADTRFLDARQISFWIPLIVFNINFFSYFIFRGLIGTLWTLVPLEILVAQSWKIQGKSVFVHKRLQMEGVVEFVRGFIHLFLELITLLFVLIVLPLMMTLLLISISSRRCTASSSLVDDDFEQNFVTHHSPTQLLKNFDEIKLLRNELPSGELGIDEGALLKWRADFGSTLDNCVILGDYNFGYVNFCWKSRWDLVLESNKLTLDRAANLEEVV